MVDVRLISIIPPPSAVSQPSSAPSVTTQGATVQPQLPTGSILSGFIINRDPTGNPILRTPNGDVLFASNFFLKIGSEVVIRLQNAGGNVSARILSVNGLAPEIAQTQSAFLRDSNVIVSGNNPQTQNTAQTAAPSAPPPAVGSNVSAIVVIPTAENATAQQSASLTPGTSLLLSVLGVNTPAPSPNVASALSQLTTPTPTAPNTPQTPNVALSTLLPENVTTAPAPNVAAPTPPTIASQIPLTPSPQIAASTQAAAQAELPQALAQTIIANVASTTEDGQTTLNSTLGILRALNVAGVKVGDQMTLRVDSVGQANSYTIAVANSAQTPPLTPLTTLSRSWPSMQFIVQLLGGGDSLAMPNMPHISDKAGIATNLGGQMLSYVSALKTGNFREWLGRNNVAALEEKGYGTLIRKAEGEFLSMARQFNETPPNQWQSLFFPVAVMGEVPQVRAFIKRDKKKNDDDEPTGDEDTRFILEMELSQFGELQMDGLVKRKDDQLKFDLIIRSHEPLPKDVSRNIEEIYYNTAALTQYNGQISFQTVYVFPVNPLEETLPYLTRDVIA